MVLFVKISNKKILNHFFLKIINAPHDVPLQYYGIGMLHKTEVKVKGTLNCDIKYNYMYMQRPNHTRYFFIAYVTSLSQFI